MSTDTLPHQLEPGVVRPATWTALPWLRAGFSTREGGFTTVYGNLTDLNLGWTASDPPETVAQNRSHFFEAVAGPDYGKIVALRQVHGNTIYTISADTGPLATPEGRPVLEGDGLITAQPNRLLAILTADCVPVLVADTRQRVVAGFHAGWRGTAARIVERGIDTLRTQFGSAPADLIAAIGPCIGPCCYTVGDEVRAQFDSNFAYSADLFSERRLDLAGANRRQLLETGIAAASISTVGECTACTRLPNGQRRYFSHRDEHGFTGRMLSVIGIAG